MLNAVAHGDGQGDVRQDLERRALVFVGVVRSPDSAFHLEVARKARDGVGIAGVAAGVHGEALGGRHAVHFVAVGPAVDLAFAEQAARDGHVDGATLAGADARPITRCPDVAAGYRENVVGTVVAATDAGAVHAAVSILAGGGHRAAGYRDGDVGVPGTAGAATDAGAVRGAAKADARGVHRTAGHLDIDIGADKTRADARTVSLQLSVARSVHLSASYLDAAAGAVGAPSDARAVRGAIVADALARGRHHSARYLNDAAGATVAAAYTGAVRKPFAKALRRKRAFAVDDHGRPIRHLQAGVVRAADEGVCRAFRQRNVRRGAGLHLKGAVIVARQPDVDARERDVRVRAGGHHDAVALGLRDAVAHGDGHGLPSQDLERRARIVVGVVRPRLAAIHLEVAREAGHREGIVGVAAVVHGEALDRRHAVHLVVFGLSVGEQASRDLRRAIDPGGARYFDAASRYRDVDARAGIAADTGDARGAIDALARSGHRAAGNLDVAAGADITAADAGAKRVEGEALAQGGHRAAGYLDVARGVAPTAADAGAKRVVLGALALRLQGAFASDGHTRPGGNLQAGALVAAGERVDGALRQRDARRGAGLDCEGAAVAVGIAARVDLDARERDVRRRRIGRRHRDAVNPRRGIGGRHGDGHGRIRQELEHVACVGIVHALRATHHREIARRNGDREGVGLLVGHRVVAHGSPLGKIDAVDLAVRIRARSEQAARDFRRRANRGTGARLRLDPTAGYRDACGRGMPAMTADAVAGIRAAFARSDHRTARYLDAAVTVVTGTNAGSSRVASSLARGGHHAPSYRDVDAGAETAAADTCAGCDAPDAFA